MNFTDRIEVPAFWTNLAEPATFKKTYNAKAFHPEPRKTRVPQRVSPTDRFRAEKGIRGISETHTPKQQTH